MTITSSSPSQRNTAAITTCLTFTTLGQQSMVATTEKLAVCVDKEYCLHSSLRDSFEFSL